MALGLFLIASSLICLIYGIRKKAKIFIVIATIILIFIVAVWVIYLYLYALTPY